MEAPKNLYKIIFYIMGIALVILLFGYFVLGWKFDWSPASKTPGA